MTASWIAPLRVAATDPQLIKVARVAARCYTGRMLNTPRTAADREARRRLAVERVAEGWTQKAVAEFLGVNPVTVNKWVRAHRDDPDAGLAAKPRPGRAPYLTEAQEKRVLGWLADKPTAHGFPTDLWTARRVADLIRRKLKVAYHPGYLRAWMGKRGYSPQKPAKVAREQDPAELSRWLRDDWSGLRKKTAATRPTSC